MFLLACANNKKPPIAVNTMKHIMFDMTVADEFFLNKLGSDTNFKKQLIKPTDLYKEVLTKHKITQKEFYAAIGFYQTYPDLMKELLDSTLSLANKNKQLLDSPALKPKTIK